jgi:hypothetical protein
MKTFAIIENSIVSNVVLCETLDLLRAFLPDSELVEVTDSTKDAYIGADYSLEDGKFFPYKSYDSWVWNKTSWCYEPPVAHPEGEGSYFWDESLVSWQELVEDPAP